MDNFKYEVNRNPVGVLVKWSEQVDRRAGKTKEVMQPKDAEEYKRIGYVYPGAFRGSAFSELRAYIDERIKGMLDKDGNFISEAKRKEIYSAFRSLDYDDAMAQHQSGLLTLEGDSGVFKIKTDKRVFPAHDKYISFMRKLKDNGYTKFDIDLYYDLISK